MHILIYIYESLLPARNTFCYQIIYSIYKYHTDYFFNIKLIIYNNLFRQNKK